MEISIPQDAYDMNYIFSDGGGTTDNNCGLDYCTETEGVMTREAWAEAAPERMVDSPPPSQTRPVLQHAC